MNPIIGEWLRKLISLAVGGWLVKLVDAGLLGSEDATLIVQAAVAVALAIATACWTRFIKPWLAAKFTKQG